MSPGICADRSLRVGERDRVYRLFVPGDGAGPMPLLLAFHGAGEAPESLFDRFLPLAQRERFALVAPAGVGLRWNAGLDDEVRETLAADDVALAAALVESVAGEAPINRGAVCAVGFSNGAALCQRLAVERAELVAGVVCVCATMPPCAAEHFTPAAPVSVLQLMGAQDRMFGRRGHFRGMPFLTAEQTAQRWAEHNGCGSPETLDQPATITHWPAAGPGGAEVALWWVEDAGHTLDLSADFDIAEVAWHFLARAISPR